MRIVGFRVRRQIGGGRLCARLHQGHQRFALKCRRQGKTEHAEESGSNVYQANPAGDATSGKDRTRELEEQGDADGFVVEEDAVHRFAMGAERLAVIRHDHDERAFIQATLSKIGEQLAQGSVGIGDLSVVGVLKARVVWRRRIVRCVRVVEVDPYKEGG